MYAQAQDCVGKSEDQENLKSVHGKMLFPDIFKDKRHSIDACWPEGVASWVAATLSPGMLTST